jgi:hypothetical protein
MACRKRLTKCVYLEFFHNFFTRAYVVSAHPLESKSWPVSPAGFFLPVIKPFPISLSNRRCFQHREDLCGRFLRWGIQCPGFGFSLFFEVFVMRLTLPALVLGLFVAQGAMAAGDGTAAIGGGLGGALGNVVGQSMGGSTGAAVGAGVAGAAGSAVAARKGSRTKAAIGGGVGAAGGSVIGNSLGGKTGSTIGAGLGGALGGGVGSNLSKGHKRH